MYQGFAFDGNYNSFVELQNVPALQTQSFTIEAWVKRANASLATASGAGGANVFGYGSGGYNLSRDTWYLNTVPRQYLSTSPLRDTAVIGALTAQVANPLLSIAFPGTGSNTAKTVNVFQLTRPYPQFTGIRPPRVGDMKMTVRWVSFFEPINRAYMIRSVAGGAYAPIAHRSGATTGRSPAADF